MRWKLPLRLITLVVLSGIAATSPVLAEDTSSKTSAAVTGVLFESDADEYVSYRIREDGYLDISFARNTPDALYSEILSKLQNHPEIKGVLAGRDGPTCSRF